MNKQHTPRRAIAQQIANNALPQGYALTTDDIGMPLSPGEGFGPVLPADVGKRCYVRDGIFCMENSEQRDRRLKGKA